MATNIVYTATKDQGNDVGNISFGSAVFDATAIVAADSVVISLGFTPRYVVWENATDRIRIEWYNGMAANSCIKTAAAGTRTLEVTGGNGGITVAQGQFSVLQNATLAAILASKTCYWYAIG